MPQLDCRRGEADRADEGRPRPDGADSRAVARQGRGGALQHRQIRRRHGRRREACPLRRAHRGAQRISAGVLICSLIPPPSGEGWSAWHRLLLLGLLVRLLARALERGAEDVAERRAGIGGAVLGDRLLLLGDLERLDRDLHLARPAVELGDAGVDLLTDREAFGALLRAVARELRALDEGSKVGADDLHLETGLLHLGDLAGDDRTLLQLARFRERIAFELLDAERDALLLDIDVEHDGLDIVALLVLVDHLLARALPVEVGEVHHAVDVAVEAEEQTEFGLVLDLALDVGARRIFLDEHLPRIAHGLLEAERYPALDRIDLEDLNFDLLRRRDDLAGMHVLLGPRHLGDVDQAFDARLELHEC